MKTKQCVHIIRSTATDELRRCRGLGFHGSDECWRHKGKAARYTAAKLEDLAPAPITAPTRALSSVNHPAHYNHGTIEAITVIEDWSLNFNMGNALKYLARADHKGTPEADLKKAIWYLQRELDRRGA